ncbi:MAG TPA: AmmeMemoRadiSam system protein B [Actinomycetota bacterium]|jgi:AmmeMemoRadiSam system protein B|nr:AmmeMemoRadiSam system protein B [Actinomycetota bacterium]
MGREETAGAAGRGLIRPPAAAGTFYPADARALSDTIDRFVDEVRPDAHEQAPAALVVPHAGYVYSGRIAAEGYARVRGRESRRVIVLGPAHFVPLRGIAVPMADAWRTPLGTVEIDPALREAAAGAGASVDDGPHSPEHAIEVQLPFLLRSLAPDWRFLPVAVGRSHPTEVADLLERLRDLADLVVVSTDLSHYLDDASARRIDRATAEAVLRLDPGGVGEDAACGRDPLRGLLAFASRNGLAPRLLRLGTSADASGEESSVVGYGAFAFA